MRSYLLGAVASAGMVIALSAQAAPVPEFAHFSFPETVRASEVETRLQAMGFTNVSSIEKQGQVFTAAAQWEGQPITVHVDVDTGWIRNNWDVSPDRKPRHVGFTDIDVDVDDIRERLMQLGFTDVNVTPDEGDAYKIDAMWNGKPYDMTLNTDTGTLWDTNYDPVRDGPPRTVNIWRPETAMVDDVRRKLSALGYTEIGEITKKGAVFETVANWQGERLALSVDGDTGLIRIVE